jgi:ferredoxin-nitrite reductase
MALGLCVPTGRVNPAQLDELAHLADLYGNGEIRLTTGQNAVIPNVPADRATKLFNEPLLKQLSPRPSPFVRGLVACVGTDYCNLALIETKSRAIALSQALDQKMGPGVNPLTIHWSGCPAGCGNHEAADLGLRGFKTKIDGKLVDAVAVYVGGRTGSHAIAGKEILATVPCDESFPDVIANVVRSSRAESEYQRQAPASDPFFTAAATAGLASWRSSSSFAPSASAV